MLTVLRRKAAALCTGLALGALALTPLAAAPIAHAQEAEMRLQVQPGQRYSVTITDTVTAPPPYAEQLASTSTVVMGLEVLAADRWRWTFEDLAIDAATLPPEMRSPAAQNAIAAAVRLMTDLGFECRVDATGRCLEITNWPQWRGRVDNLSTLVTSAMMLAPQTSGGASPNMAEVAPRIEQFVTAMMNGVDGRSAATGLTNLYPLAAVQGRTLRRGEAVTVTESWAMPYGAAPVSVAGTVRLESIDTRAQTAVVTRSARANPDSIRGAMAALLNGLSAPAVQAFGNLTPEAGAQIQMVTGMAQGFLQGSSIDFEETTRGVVDLRTGLARDTNTTYVFTLKSPLLAQSGSDTMAITTRSVIRVEAGAPRRLPRATAAATAPAAEPASGRNRPRGGGG